ncbi:hypothetical protein D9M68_618340 [compost metagenome]
MLVLFVLLVFFAMAVTVVAVVASEFVGERATGCAAEAGADGRTGAATDLATKHRATCSAQTTTQCRFGLVAVARGDHPAGRTANPGANGCTGAAADLLADDVAQCTADAATDGDFAIVASQGVRRGDKTAESERR